MTQIPFRLAILKRLVAHLELLHEGTNPAYTFDLRDKVFRGRHVLGEEAADFQDLPVVSILESPRPDLSIFTGEWDSVRKDYWTLLIQGIDKDDKLAPTDRLYHLTAQIEMHLSRLIDTHPQKGTPLYPTEHLLGGLISGLEIAAPIVRPSEKGVSARAFFYLPLRLQLAVDLSKPYASV